MPPIFDSNKKLTIIQYGDQPPQKFSLLAQIKKLFKK
tara:strand:+ start:818 stop:928 length:111 start_codon:yes stop_codon:yes gene_type:complete